MDAYDIPGACESVRQFVDAMTNWYIRRSRERFWDTAPVTVPRAAAFDTLYTALEVLTRVPPRCCPWSPRRSGAASPADVRCT